MNIEQRNAATAFLFEQEPYSRILSVLREGAVYGIHAKELSKLTGPPDRELRKMIEYIRRNGVVIIADNNGYYFPSNTWEIGEYIKQEERRAKSTFYTLKGARALLKELTPFGMEGSGFVE